MLKPAVHFLSRMIITLAAIILEQDSALGNQLESSLSSHNEIMSRFVCKMSYGLQDDGSAKGQKRCTKTWFDGSRLRVDDYVGDIPTACRSGGRIAFPAAGREWEHPSDYSQERPYPEQVRAHFARISAERKPIGNEILKGLICLKYAYHEDKSHIGCIHVPNHDVYYWVNANEQFPLLMKYETVYDGKLTH